MQTDIEGQLSQEERRGDFAFLNGGDNPNEQILEFQQLDPHIPIGGQLMAHDARVRKGKYFVPYLQQLDHWRSQVHDSSEVGLLTATKIAASPRSSSPPYSPANSKASS